MSFASIRHEFASPSPVPRQGAAGTGSPVPQGVQPGDGVPVCADETMIDASRCDTPEFSRNGWGSQAGTEVPVVFEGAREDRHEGVACGGSPGRTRTCSGNARGGERPRGGGETGWLEGACAG